MKRFAMALALVCALSTSILAGDMPAGGKSEPPPPTISNMSMGDMPTVGKAEVPPPPTTSSTLLANMVLTIFTLIR